MEGNLRLKIDWASLLLGRKITVFLCFTLYLTDIPKNKPPAELIFGGAIERRVFCVTSLGGLYLEGLIHGETYFRNFTVSSSDPKWNNPGVILTQKSYLILSTSKAAGNNISKFFKKSALTSLKWAHRMTIIQFQTSCARLVLISRNSERDRSVHLDALLYIALPICASFVDFVLCFCSINWKAKFIFYKREKGSWIWKAWRYPLVLFKVLMS